MAKIPNLAVARLRRLRKHPDDVWQGAIIPMPVWLEEDGAEPVRPRAPVWRSRNTGLAQIGNPVRPGEVDSASTLGPLGALAQMKEIGYRPARLEVREPWRTRTWR